MNIALAILHADPARGGAERYTADLAADLAGRGQAVSILAADFGPPISGVRFVPIDNRGVTRRGQYVRFLDSLEAHRSKTAYDIFHAMLPVRACDVYHPHAGIAAEAMAAGHLKYDGQFARAASRLGNRLNRRRRLQAEVERKLLTGADPPVLLCLSDFVRQAAARHYQLAPGRCATLLNGVDLERFDPAAASRPQDRANLDIDEGRIVMLFVAQNFALKGLSQAIAALGRINDPRMLLLVAGRDERGPYERLARDCNVAGQVRFLGQISDPRPLYRAADWLVLPTKRDSCSLVVLEALAMGLPVISTAANGACEIMEPGRHGYVMADPADVTALAEAMRKLMDEPARAEMRQACLELRTGLSSRSHVDRLLEIYASARSFSQKSTARGRE